MSIERNAGKLTDPFNNFTSNLEALREFLGVVDAFLQRKGEDFALEHEADLIPLRLATSIASKTPSEKLSVERERELRLQFGAPINLTAAPDGTTEISIQGEAGKRFVNSVGTLSKNSAHQHLLYKNCLISLVSSAEWFLSQVLTRFFESFPEAAGLKDKTLTLEDLRRIGTVEEAEAYLIRLRVDEIMWGGLDDWLKFLKNTVKLSLGYLTEDEEALKEVFQRRNVMVHNNGIVHPSYLSKIPEAARPGVVAGEPLFVPAAYLRGAIDILEKQFLLIAAELWKKVAPKDEKRGGVLNNIAMKALLAERYLISSGISRFQGEDKQLPEKWWLYARINFWQTMKWDGQFAAVETEIRQADFSAKDDLSRLEQFTVGYRA